MIKYVSKLCYLKCYLSIEWHYYCCETEILIIIVSGLLKQPEIVIGDFEFNTF